MAPAIPVWFATRVHRHHGSVWLLELGCVRPHLSSCLGLLLSCWHWRRRELWWGLHGQRCPGAGSVLTVVVVFQPVEKCSLQSSNYRELSSLTVCLCLKAPLYSRASLGEYDCWPVVSTLLGENRLGFQLAWSLTESWQSYTQTPEDVDNTQNALSTHLREQLCTATEN